MLIPFETISGFCAAALLLSFIPGPDNLFVLTQSALRGLATGIVVTTGLCTGLIVHTIAVALGVAVIFQTSAFAFSALKIIGAAYLLYLAYKAFRAPPEGLDDEAGGAQEYRKMYLRGILMNVTNPKVAIFFLAFLPQFTSPARGYIVLQMLLLGALFIVSAFVSFSVISLLAGSLSRWLTRSKSGQIILNRVAGVVFIGLAIKLVLSHQ